MKQRTNDDVLRGLMNLYDAMTPSDPRKDSVFMETTYGEMMDISFLTPMHIAQLIKHGILEKRARTILTGKGNNYREYRWAGPRPSMQMVKRLKQECKVYNKSKPVEAATATENPAKHEYVRTKAKLPDPTPEERKFMRLALAEATVKYMKQYGEVLVHSEDIEERDNAIEQLNVIQTLSLRLRKEKD